MIDSALARATAWNVGIRIRRLRLIHPAAAAAGVASRHSHEFAVHMIILKKGQKNEENSYRKGHGCEELSKR